MKKIYFIEGLPGSGKTTMVRKLSEYLKSLNKDVVIYNLVCGNIFTCF